LTHPFKLKKVAKLCAGSGEVMVIPTTTPTSPLCAPFEQTPTLRHTFAHNYLTQHPADIVVLATLLGHTSLDTTRIYSQPTGEQLATHVEGLRQNAYVE
jgi:integrase/recombinase XerC